MKIVSWNVNGIVACRRKGFLKFLADAKPDVVCCQEVKTQCPLNTPGYLQFWNPAQRKGYAGTLILTKREPLSVSYGMGIEAFDIEGRLITLEYKDFYVVNVYSPSLHVHSSPDRLDYRIAWDAALKRYISKFQKPVVMCGDFNATMSEIDTYPDKQKVEPDDPFFTSDLRDGLKQLLSTGLTDAYRVFNPRTEGAYTWWGPKNQNRAFNRGSRLDYFLVSGELLPFVQSIKFHVDTLGSDHCPISMSINPVVPKRDLDNEDLAVIWRTIDWPRMKDELAKMQRNLAMAAYEREWEHVKSFQQKIVLSWAARVLAVQAVVDANSEIGVDGVRWTTDAQRAKAAQSLLPRGYRPLPYRNTVIKERDGKKRVIHVPAARDKAMMILYTYALDPVAESTAERKSFSARKGRSSLDAHAYLIRDLSGENAPGYVVIIDVKAFYESAIHQWLIEYTPMDKVMLRKFLKAGVIRDGELFPTDQGLSLGTSLSPTLGNMMLDGLQSYIYDRLYPNGKVDYADGNVIRFCDDILVTTRSRERGSFILEIVIDFLADRGLRINSQKTAIRDVIYGFDFLGRHYCKKGRTLYAVPSDESINRAERKLSELILNYHGTLRTLIEKINRELRGLASYHRAEDAYMAFRRIDNTVELLLVKRMCEKYPRWHRETVLNKFWIKDGNEHIFALPTDPSIRVMRIATTPIVQYKPCKLKFNPYLDEDYYQWLQNKRQMQRVNGKYRAVWERQGGKCAYCHQPMLPDQELEVIENELGMGRNVKNLLYIHRGCAYTTVLSDEGSGERIDLFALLEGYTDEAPRDESPYLELTEYFRLCDKSVFTLQFWEIEQIIQVPLPWEALFYEAFWYDGMPGLTSSMWREEGFPFHMFKPSEPNYCIAESWLTQGYKIKALSLDHRRVVFRRSENYKSGLLIPKQLTTRRIPDAAVKECKGFFEYLIKKYGL